MLDGNVRYAVEKIELFLRPYVRKVLLEFSLLTCRALHILKTVIVKDLVDARVITAYQDRIWKLGAFEDSSKLCRFEIVHSITI